MSQPLETQPVLALRHEGAEGYSVPAAGHASVLEGHALWAPTYDRDPNPLLALEQRELEPLLPELNGKVVIDLACGTGRWLEKLIRRGARAAAGVDLSPEMLAQARTKPTLRGRLTRGDVLALPFRAGVVDLMVCSFAVGYIHNLHVLARELAQIARRPADLFLTDFHPAGHQKGWRRVFRHTQGTVEMASVPHSIEQIRGAFESEGFKLVRCSEPCIGEPEKPIFAQTAKSHLFPAACEAPAVFICHFKLLNPPVVKEG